MFKDITSITFAKGTHNLSKKTFIFPVTFNAGYTSWKLNSKYKVTARKLPKDTELEKKSFRNVTPLSAHTFLMQPNALIGLAVDDRQRKKKRERNNIIIICQHLIHVHNEPRSQFTVINWVHPGNDQGTASLFTCCMNDRVLSLENNPVHFLPFGFWKNHLEFSIMIIRWLRVYIFLQGFRTGHFTLL